MAAAITTDGVLFDPRRRLYQMLVSIPQSIACASHFQVGAFCVHISVSPMSLASGIGFGR